MDINELKSINIKKVIANYIIPLIALVLTLSILGFYIYPSISEIPILEEELQTQTELSTRLKNKVTKLNDLLDFKQNVDDSEALVSKALAPEPLVPQLLSQLDQIARDAGLAVDRLSYALNASGDEDISYDVVSVNMSVSGSVNQLVTFLESAENASRVINISNVRYTLDLEANTVSASFIAISPFVDLKSAPSIDDPISFDITDPTFQQMMEDLRSLRHYDISVENFINVENVPVIDPNAEEESIEGDALEGDTAPEGTPINVPAIGDESTSPFGTETTQAEDTTGATSETGTEGSTQGATDSTENTSETN